MKNELQTVGFLLLFLFAFIFFSSSCASSATSDRFAYAKKELTVEISGFIDEKKTEAVLYNAPNAEGEEIRATLRFSSPESLCGMTVTLRANGECSARLNGTVADTDGLEGLIEPFRPVFDIGEIYSVKKNASGGEDIKVCDENCDLTYVFAAGESTPSRIFGKYYGKNIDLTLGTFSYAPQSR